MNRLRPLILLVGILGLAHVAHAALTDYSQAQSVNRSRSCVPKPASTSTLAITTGSSAPSSELTSNAQYLLSCTTAVYLDTGATEPTASSADFYLPADTIFPFPTGGASNVSYVAALGVSGSGTCYLVECQ